MDYSVLLQHGVLGIPLIAIVLGLVQYIKGLGLQGKAVQLVSMLVGLLIGGVYMIATTGVPVDLLGWFTDAMVGLIYGLVASGIFDVGVDISSRKNS